MITAHAQVVTRIKELTSKLHPDYSIDGESVQFGAHLQQLSEMEKALREAIIREQGPYEVRSYGRT